LGGALAALVLAVQPRVRRLEFAARLPGELLEGLVGRLELLLRLRLVRPALLHPLDEQVTLVVAERLHRAVIDGAAGGTEEDREGDEGCATRHACDAASCLPRPRAAPGAAARRHRTRDETSSRADAVPRRRPQRAGARCLRRNASVSGQAWREAVRFAPPAPSWRCRNPWPAPSKVCSS